MAVDNNGKSDKKWRNRCEAHTVSEGEILVGVLCFWVSRAAHRDVWSLIWDGKQEVVPPPE